MKDEKTLAYVNMYGLLGALEDLCREVPEAAKLAGLGMPPKPVRVGFAIRRGPAFTLEFVDQACICREGGGPCDIRLAFGSFERFNGLIDGTVTPLPRKGWTKIGFLTGNFTKLTKMLETYLRPAPGALEDPAFFRASTIILFYLIARALVQIGNQDEIGRFTASNLADGTVVLSIRGEEPPLQAAITIADHRLSFSRTPPGKHHGIMEFSSLPLARDLFDGRVSALGCVGQGLITLRGNLGMLDNLNRLLDRVAAYLA